MKTGFSVIDRLRFHNIPRRWFGTAKSVPLHKSMERTTLEEAACNAITGIYMFRAQANEVQLSGNASAYAQTVALLSDTLKQFDNVESGAEAQKTLAHISLLSSSINNSLSRLAELLDTFGNEKIDQKKESTTSALAEAERICNALYQHYDAKKSDDQLSKVVEEKLEDLDKTITTLQESVQAL